MKNSVNRSPLRRRLSLVPLSLASTLAVSALIAFATIDTRADTCTAPPSGLVGWWPGDGNADDIIGGNNGTLQNGATFSSGEVAQAFSFNGSSYVDASDSNLPIGDSSATISAWINTTQSHQAI